ncbi:hypothetical protein [Haloferax volcanii]|uniref:hypothetical protein n=1 Tax=Haloferax volcanii TaxID=2246 RepID=UPI00249B78C4|nr:hypothetical protein [Haloferax alexandrinus]WEL30611.1 hypothetical protein HBNXHx_2516 [Haloferax alexandrinus]
MSLGTLRDGISLNEDLDEKQLAAHVFIMVNLLCNGLMTAPVALDVPGVLTRVGVYFALGFNGMVLFTLFAREVPR